MITLADGEVRFISADLPSYEQVATAERMRDFYAGRFAEATIAGAEREAAWNLQDYVHWRDEAARMNELRTRLSLSPHPGALWQYFEHRETWS